jgi:hypothetical protein
MKATLSACWWKGLTSTWFTAGGTVVEHHDVHQAVRVEVADTDGAQLAGLVGPFHGAPGTMHVAVRLVDQVQVQVVQLQAAQRRRWPGGCARKPVSCTQSLVVTNSSSRATPLRAGPCRRPLRSW